MGVLVAFEVMAAPGGKEHDANGASKVRVGGLAGMVGPLTNLDREEEKIRTRVKAA